MEDWKRILEEADDDYLAGIANKGIVKRAYKDKEEGDYKILSSGEELRVSVGRETVEVRNPLGESKCSCPSRTICRHVVLGILVLKEQMEKESGQGDGRKPEGREAGQQEVQAADGQQKVREEIAACSLGFLRKILGERQLQAISGQAKAGRKPEVSGTNVLTVELPLMGQRVKLLSPLEYSSCSCHKKGFCVHKAAAVLWCKLEAGQLTAGELEEEAGKKQEYDRDQIGNAAGQMKEFLEELLYTGLARISPDALDSMERMAVIGHNARLARFEGYWRALKDSYDSYQKRKASFRLEVLMGQLAKLYRRTELLLEAESGGEIERLAGEFRAEYREAGDLDLIGIAMEHFEGQAGYEGETLYFLEDRTKEWYTYTIARPVFYEKPGRRGKREKAAAPWGLPLSLAELAKSRIRLKGAKCDSRGRLSSSQETKGELAEGGRKGCRLYTEELGEWYFRDFGRLYSQWAKRENISWLEEKEEENIGLYFVHPETLGKAIFSEAEQKLFLDLYDKEQRKVTVEVAYSKKESWGIRYLERIKEESSPCFLGKIYLRDGALRMYPVAVLEKEELEGGGNLEEGSHGEKMEKAGGKEEYREKEEVLGILLEDVGNLLEELYQSGFSAVHDSTLEAMYDMAKLTEQYGMEYLSDRLGKLAEGLSMARHRMDGKMDGLAGYYAGLVEYLYLCKGKNAFQKGWNKYVL